jgi:tetratricopeptide (TPR) repeat protein
MGNLESADTAADNLEKAVEYFERAIAIRLEGGDGAGSVLANSYLCMSRVYYLQKEYKTAQDMVAQSEALFFRLSGADIHFMAQYHLPYV